MEMSTENAPPVRDLTLSTPPGGGPTVLERVLVWGAGQIDESTIRQAQRTARLPFVREPLALMPDAHVGIGATVGSVAFMEGAIVPAAVGVDIGCGMIAARTNLSAPSLPDDLSLLLSLISRRIPAGVGAGHADEQAGVAQLGKPASELGPKDAAKLARQFGSLGSGNHFVELCLDEDERVWMVLHSGSRGIGNSLAERHIAAAKAAMCRYLVKLEDPDLAYVVEGTPEFEAYIADMLWAQRYAAANREAMMTAALASLAEVTGGYAKELERINCHHNFAAKEQQRGRGGWVVRKGAIRARAGDRGLIPGSMGTSSYVVTGLGNPASFESCSHGAGRRLSRTSARRELSAESLGEAMRGKVWQSSEARSLVDEHPLAYKDVEAVMAAQADLVRIDHRLVQVLNYKGT
jgi:RNA-splicing ligase RtcB